jgi:hypothetical protein
VFTGLPFVVELILADRSDILSDDFPRLKKALSKKFLCPLQVSRGVRNELGLALWGYYFDLHTCSLADPTDI